MMMVIYNKMMAVRSKSEAQTNAIDEKGGGYNSCGPKKSLRDTHILGM
jgi:hypothetical protein